MLSGGKGYFCSTVGAVTEEIGKKIYRRPK
jgi:hypothetical protein